MNKAFVKESDNDDDDDLPQAQALPAGTKNYMTPEGYERLRGELAHLMNVERPSVVQVVSWAASMATVPRTAIISTARNVCARSTAACAS